MSQKIVGVSLVFVLLFAIVATVNAATVSEYGARVIFKMKSGNVEDCFIYPRSGRCTTDKVVPPDSGNSERVESVSLVFQRSASKPPAVECVSNLTLRIGTRSENGWNFSTFYDNGFSILNNSCGPKVPRWTSPNGVIVGEVCGYAMVNESLDILRAPKLRSSGVTEEFKLRAIWETGCE